MCQKLRTAKMTYQNNLSFSPILNAPTLFFAAFSQVFAAPCGKNLKKTLFLPLKNPFFEVKKLFF